MIRFECDYNTGAHPAILQRLLETNEEQTPGYGEDPYCESARKRIRADPPLRKTTMPGTKSSIRIAAASRHIKSTKRLPAGMAGSRLLLFIVLPDQYFYAFS